MKITLLIVICFYIYEANAKTIDCTKGFYAIPEEDRKELELFFHDLIKESQFGYTIFSDKPVSIKGYFVTTPFGNLIAKNKVNNTKKLWEKWRYYSHLFPMNKYLLFDEPTSHDNLGIITLINIRAFIEKFNQHTHLFKDRLGKEVTADSLIERLRASETQGLYKILNEDEELYGILLGYRKASASTFKRFFELDSYLNPLSQREFSMKWPKPSNGFGSLKEEYHFLRKQFIEPQSGHMLAFIQPVCFMAVQTDLETELLLKKYKKDKRKISKIYGNKGFMRTSLEKLCQ